MEHQKDFQYFLRIEKITKGRIEGLDLWDEIPLKEKGLIIGRPSKDPGMVVPDIKIVGDDSITRGDHVSILFSNSDNCFKVCDRHSSYGTFLNGKLLEKKAYYTLKDNMLIGLSGKRFVFRFRDSYSSLPPENIDDDDVKSRKPELEINLKAKKVTRGDVDIFLTRTELKVLEYLHLNLDKACTVESIAKHVWGDEYKRVDLVTQYIRRLRKKIESNPTEPRYIVTVAGRHGCYLLNL